LEPVQPFGGAEGDAIVEAGLRLYEFHART